MNATNRCEISPPTGVAIEAPQYEVVCQEKLRQNWFEIKPEFLMGRGGALHRFMRGIAADNVVSFRCAGLSVGDADGMDDSYLLRLKSLIDTYDPVLISGFAAWRQYGAVYLATPLPVLFTPAHLEKMVRNVAAVQTAVGRRILVENIVHFGASNKVSTDEPAFLNLLARASGCGIFLNITNVVVTCKNLGLSTAAYLCELDPDFVGQLRLPCTPFGQTKYEQDVFADEVWRAYDLVLDHCGPKPAIIDNGGGAGALGSLLRQAEEVAQIQQRHQDTMRDSRVA